MSNKTQFLNFESSICAILILQSENFKCVLEWCFGNKLSAYVYKNKGIIMTKAEI